ncbi:HalOD1 output domain-containing protein [Natrinema soli]|uniref:HalOD1 output domain-containing protein n=1 Tax=Natrinema soli TaxID=1930624 RepID=A0ABD5SSV1_9EURY|nr:HalOD1 output domain-containing protein [Natrinema soli]
METESPTGERQLRNESGAYQFESNKPLSEAVLAAVASESGLDALELADEFGPLYDVVDPTALDSLFQSAGENGRSVGSVTFEYAAYRVTVDQTGRIELVEQQ